MPKVSDAHLQARREQILDAAMACFADAGFQATSIAEIIAASGLSAGSVYRYFPSKDDLIEAIVRRVLGETADRFDAMLADGAAPDPAEAVYLAVESFHRIASTGAVDLTRVAVQAWGEALRNDRVLTVVTDAFTTVRGYFEEVVRRAQAAGVVPEDTDPEALGPPMLSLVVGFLVQRAVLGDVELETYGDAVRTLVGRG